MSLSRECVLRREQPIHHPSSSSSMNCERSPILGGSVRAPYGVDVVDTYNWTQRSGGNRARCLERGPQRFLAMGRPSEVIVIGAGVIGCSVAYELARRGASVEVVD